MSAQELARFKEHPSIEFAGFQSDVRPYIQRASAILLPSYREGVPRTLLEGLSMGRPIIATNVPGCREVVVEGENGWTVPARDASALAQVLEKFYQLDPQTRLEMGGKSRKLAENKFSIQVINEQYLNEIQRILQHTRDELT